MMLPEACRLFVTDPMIESAIHSHRFRSTEMKTSLPLSPCAKSIGQGMDGMNLQPHASHVRKKPILFFSLLTNLS